MQESKPLGVVTEVQLHLLDCVVDYRSGSVVRFILRNVIKCNASCRPQDFNYRAVIEINSFIFSSNVISLEACCTLRFIVEDCVFSLAPYVSVLN